MGIFSVIRRGRQKAKEVQAKKEEQKKKEAHNIPYKHVPTHAAVDALHSAPPTWAVEERLKSTERNQTRSARISTTASFGANPQAHLSMSNVMYPSVHAVGGVPRTYSYSGLSSRQSLRSVIYSDGVHVGGGKRKEALIPDTGDLELPPQIGGNRK